MNREIWKPLPLDGYRHSHMISNLGRIKRIIDLPKKKAPFFSSVSHGYCFITNEDKLKSTVNVGKLVMLAFGTDSQLDGFTHKLYYKDGNVYNNSYENLSTVQIKKVKKEKRQWSKEEIDIRTYKRKSASCLQCINYPCMRDRDNNIFEHKTTYAKFGCIKFKKK